MRISWRGMPRGHWHDEAYIGPPNRSGVAKTLNRRRRYRSEMGMCLVPAKGRSWVYDFPHLDPGQYWILALLPDREPSAEVVAP